MPYTLVTLLWYRRRGVLNKLQSPDVCEQEGIFSSNFRSMVTLVQDSLFANLFFVATNIQSGLDLANLH